MAGVGVATAAGVAAAEGDGELALVPTVVFVAAAVVPGMVDALTQLKTPTPAAPAAADAIVSRLRSRRPLARTCGVGRCRVAMLPTIPVQAWPCLGQS